MRDSLDPLVCHASDLFPIPSSDNETGKNLLMVIRRGKRSCHSRGGSSPTSISISFPQSLHRPQSQLLDCQGDVHQGVSPTALVRNVFQTSPLSQHIMDRGLGKRWLPRRVKTSFERVFANGGRAIGRVVMDEAGPRTFRGSWSTVFVTVPNEVVSGASLWMSTCRTRVVRIFG